MLLSFIEAHDTSLPRAAVDVAQALASTYPDVWRRLHPDTEGSYTVWEERTNARAFNVVSAHQRDGARGRTRSNP